MERFILYKEQLFNSYEWSGGIEITPKICRDRQRMIKNGDAILVENFDTDKTKKHIQRKV
jgi:translation initiation factor IF-1